MSDQRFGGNWTQEKLLCLQNYILAYRKIFANNPNARTLTTWYVDAFAGTGVMFQQEQSSNELSLFEDVYLDPESKGYIEGSALIALRIASPFDNYLFIEKSKEKSAILQKTIERDFPTLVSRCTFLRGDANTELGNWCKQRNWTKERAVVFLDPYGMQVDWTTVEVLAKTKAVDLWYLFPLGIGVARLLKRDGAIDESWQRRLTSIFGTQEWRERFYRSTTTPSLFGDVEGVERMAGEDRIEEFICERLGGCFERVAKGRILRNSRSSPLYLLCFASANKKGAPTAVKIAQHILES